MTPAAWDLTMARRLPAISLLLSGLVVGPSGSVYDVHGQRQGYVTESRPGQFDLYDAHSRRLGYGRRSGRADRVLRPAQPAAPRDPAGADGAASVILEGDGS